MFADVSVLIPAYNPDEKLVRLVSELKACFSVIVIVDDGSTVGKDIFDALASIVTTVVRHPYNQGKGMALKSGIAWVQEHLPAVRGVVTADADGQHRPDDIVKVAQALSDGYQGLVMGVRSFSGNVPFRSRLGNACTRWVFFLLVRMFVRDTQTGLRGIPRVLFSRMLSLTGERYEYEMQMLADAKSYPQSPLQIPIETIYMNENRSSHFNPIRDSIRVWGALLHFCISSFGAFLLDNGIFYLMLWITQHVSSRLSLDVLISLLTARFLSGNFQYFYNKRVTFKAQTGRGAFLKYWALVIVLGVISYWGVDGLLRLLGIDHRLLVVGVKIAVESVLFVMSFVVQKCFVFRSAHV